MAWAPEAKCSQCKQDVERVPAPDTKYGRIALNDTDDHVGNPLATWALYLDPRTGNWFARKVTPRMPLAPDERAVIPHYRTCPSRTYQLANS